MLLSSYFLLLVLSFITISWFVSLINLIFTLNTIDIA